jgi:putative flippase GtrA
MTIVEQFMGRDAGALVQFVKYAIGGGIATSVHILIFHLFAWRVFPALQADDWAVRWFKLSVPPEGDALRSRNSMIDNGIGFLFSNFVAYLVNIFWVFQRGKHGFLVEFGLFYLVSGVSVLIGTALMGYAIRRYGVRTTYAFLCNLVTALLINFAMRKFVIFKG